MKAQPERMMKQVLRLLPIFGGLLVAVPLLFSGIMSGVRRAAHEILGMWKPPEHPPRLVWLTPLLGGSGMGLMLGWWLGGFAGGAVAPLNESRVLAGAFLSGLSGGAAGVRHDKLKGSLAGCLIGGLLGGLLTTLAGDALRGEETLIVFVMIGIGLASLIGKKLNADHVLDCLNGRMILAGLLTGSLSGWCAGWIADVATEYAHMVIGGLAGGVGGYVVARLLADEWGFVAFVYQMLSQFLILLWVKPMLCPHCLRITRSFRPKDYQDGLRRCCTQCYKWFEYSDDPGKLILTFGKITPPATGRILVLSDPDFKERRQQIEVSAVPLDPPTADHFLLERFLTYIVNYPSERGLKAVQIFYRGNLDGLGGNFKNARGIRFHRSKK